MKLNEKHEKSMTFHVSSCFFSLFFMFFSLSLKARAVNCCASVGGSLTATGLGLLAARLLDRWGLSL